MESRLRVFWSKRASSGTAWVMFSQTELTSTCLHTRTTPNPSSDSDSDSDSDSVGSWLAPIQLFLFQGLPRKTETLNYPVINNQKVVKDNRQTKKKGGSKVDRSRDALWVA